MTTMPHNADLCSDSLCLLPMCINWKMRNKLNCTKGGNNRTTSKPISSHAISPTSRTHHEAVTEDSCHTTPAAVSGDNSSLQLTMKRKALLEALRKKARKSSEEYSLSVAATEESQSDLGNSDPVQGPVIHKSSQIMEAQGGSFRRGRPPTTATNMFCLPKTVLSSQDSPINHVLLPDVSEAVSSMAAWISPMASHLSNGQSTAQTNLPLSSPFDTTSGSCSYQGFELIEQFLPSDLQCYSDLPGMADMSCVPNSRVTPLSVNQSCLVSEYATSRQVLSDDTSWISRKCNTPLTMQTAQQCDTPLSYMDTNSKSHQEGSQGSNSTPVPTEYVNAGQFEVQVARNSHQILTESNSITIKTDADFSGDFSAELLPTATQTDTHLIPRSSICGSPLPNHGSIKSSSVQYISGSLNNAAINCVNKIVGLLNQPRSTQLDVLLTSILEETVLKLDRAPLDTGRKDGFTI